MNAIARARAASVAVLGVGGLAWVAAMTMSSEGCSRDDIVVATLREAGANLTVCTDDGTDDDCLPGQFCATESCGHAGTCQPMPDAGSCAADDGGPVCGCDNISYISDCQRQVAATSVRHAGQCVDPTVACADAGPSCITELTPRTCTDTNGCPDPSTQSCAFVVPPIENLPAPLELEQIVCDAVSMIPSLGVCWGLPETCPAGAPKTVVKCGDDLSRCVDECSAIRAGGFYLPCPTATTN